MLGKPHLIGKFREFYRFFPECTQIYTFITAGKEKLYSGKFTVVKIETTG